MTTESIINQIAMQSPQGLSKVYEGICEIYRKRLCEQWDFGVRDSWWIPSDRPGEILAIGDCEFSLSMEDVRLFVDLAVGYEDFKKWWDYAIAALDQGHHPINSYSWFKLGARPKDLKE